MSEPQNQLDRLEELACDAALFGLPEPERLELRRLALAGSAAEARLPADVETLVGELATAVPRLELPSRLRERLLADVTTTFVAPPRAVAVELADTVVPLRRPRWSAYAAGALLAAAAAVAIMLLPPRPEPVSAPGAAVARTALLTAPGTITWQFGATGDRAGPGATGDVVWNADRQEGYMRIAGLSANDAAVEQYQLWIFDATRDDRYPVDGGVFDVGPGGEVIIPITARLPVRTPALFAITVEKPGGVVVSSRERIVLAAKPG